MATIVLPAKRRRDVQRYAFDFSNIILPTETISTALVVARTFSGADPEPNLILLGEHTATATEVFQDVQQGIAGVIYELYVQVTTTLDFTYTIEARLAVLPDNTQAEPNRYPILFSSPPYPVFSQSSTTIEAGMLGGGKDVIIKQSEPFQESAVSFGFDGGVLRIMFKSGTASSDTGILFAFPAGTITTLFVSGDAGTEAGISFAFGDGSNAGSIVTPSAISARTSNDIGISMSFSGGFIHVP